MAERRMFTKKITESDAFLDMPTSSQALYFHLSMNADDDGFINAPKKIQRIVGASDDDMKLLLAKKFIIAFDSGIIVIKHWKMHNYIQSDRYKPTDYIEEKAMLETDAKKAYTLDKNALDTKCIQSVSVGKDRLGKDRLGKDREEIKHTHTTISLFIPPSLDELEEFMTEEHLTFNSEKFLAYYSANGWKVGSNPMEDWKATARMWSYGDEEDFR